MFPSVQKIVSFLRQNFRLTDQFEFQPINIKLQYKITKQIQCEINVDQTIKSFLNLSHQKSIEKQSKPQKHQKLTEKYSTKNISSFQTENKTSAPTTTNISKILQNYFTYQQEKENRKNCHNLTYHVKQLLKPIAIV